MQNVHNLLCDYILFRANGIGRSMEKTTVVQEQIKDITGTTRSDVH